MENVSYTYNTQKNRLLTAGANSFNYDNEGQISSGYGSSYTFDYEHRLTAIGSNIQFTYNGKGDRLQAVKSGATTRYIYDASGNLLAEADGNNNITRYYIHGKGLLAMVTPQDQTYCYHYNATGSTIALTDMSQSIVNASAYDPFGNMTNQVETIQQPFKYVGQFSVMTEPNGFYYMRARYYDPQVGRFISEDPIGFDGGDVNLMAYVANNPIMGIDPSGLWNTPLHSEDSQFVDIEFATTFWNPFGGFQWHFGVDTQTALSRMSNAKTLKEYNLYKHAWEDSYCPAHTSVIVHLLDWGAYILSGRDPKMHPDSATGKYADRFNTMVRDRENLPAFKGK